ncbi:MAG: enoyl-CoA hydratase [Polaromonas sp.]|nr:enoyl-CoA hydratase [Polaromonas sp.]
MSISYELSGAIVVITINRESRMNALGPQAMVEFREALERFDRAPESRVAVITGAGRKSFCAGADIRETLPSQPFIPGFFDRDTDASHPLYIRNISFEKLMISKPLIAAVNGVAVGGGMEIALNCDLCIGSTAARFGLTEVRIGSIPAVAGIQRLLHSISRPAAMQLLLSGEIIAAQRALELGIVSEIVEPELLLGRAMEIAQQIAANAPLAVKAAKYLAGKAHTLPLNQAAEFEELLWGHLMHSDDRLEGRKAFAEKRQPEFKGC